MKIKLENLVLALKEQGPFKRAFRNFVITRNAWGMFSKKSHFRGKIPQEKVGYRSKVSAAKAAQRMKEKHHKHFSVYKCIYCDDYHIGKNRNNK